MSTVPLNISRELQSENYYVDNVKGWDEKIIHFYLTYLKYFLVQLQEQRFDPMTYSVPAAKKELKTVNTAIKSFEFLVKLFESIKEDSNEISEVYSTLKKISKDLKNNKTYLENLADQDKNIALKMSLSKLKLSNFLAD